MAELCAGDADQLNALWQRADDERRARQLAGPPAADGTAATAGGTTSTVPTVATSSTILQEDPEPSAGLRPARSRWGWMMFAGAVLACAVVGGAAGLGIGLSLRTTPAEPARPYTQWLTRPEVLSRVQMWHPHSDQRIPYSQSRFYQGYRTDGSGYASMAIGLPTPGPNSPDLASGQYSRRIAPTELLPGDLVINSTGDAGTRQVAIFDKWADTGHTRYWVYQQRRGYGTDHLVLSYPLGADSQYHAYRPLNIHEVGSPRPST
jgi:hypothetical protein